MPERIGLAATMDMGEFNKGVKRYTGSIQKMNKLTATITGKMGRAFVGVGKFVGKTMVAGIAVGATAIAGLAAGMTKLAIDAAPLQGIKAAFEGITEASGVASDEMLAALKESSAGMMTNKAAMEAYNLAAMLVGETFANDLPNAMGFLTKVSAATGESMDFMMTSLVRGVGRLSPMILDNLGIQVDLTKAYEDHAAQLGITTDEMTKAQQQTALMNQVMVLLEKNTAAMPEVTGTAAAAMGSLKAQLQDTKDEIGLALLPAFTTIMGKLSEFANENLPKLVAVFEKDVIPAISELVEKVGWVIDAFRDAGIVSSEFEEALSSIVGEEIARFIVDTADAISQLYQKVGWVIDAFRDAGIVSSEFEEALSSIIGEEPARIFVDMADAVSQFVEKMGWVIDAFRDAGIVSSEFEEALSSIVGEEVARGIVDFADAVKDVAAFIERDATPILAGLATVITAKLIIAMVAWATTMWTTTIPAIVAAVIAAGPLILIIGAIALAVGLLVKAWQSDWKGIRTTLTKFWEEKAKPIFEKLKVWFTTTLPAALVTIRDWFVETWEKITTAVTDAWNKAVQIFEDVKLWFTVTMPTAISDAWETIKGTVADAIEAVRTTISDTLASIRAVWETAWGAVGDFLQKAWDTIRLIFVTALVLVLDIFGLKLEDLIRLWRTSWDNMIAGLSMAWQAIKTIVVTVFTAVSSWLSTQLTLMLRGWTLIWDAVSSKATEIWEAIKTVVGDAAEAVWGYVSEQLDLLSAGWTLIWDAVSTKASEIWETIKAVMGDAIGAVVTALAGKYDEVKDAVTDPLTDAWQAIQDTLGDWLQIGKDILQGLIDGVIDMAHKLIDAIVGAVQGAIDRAKKLLGIESASRVFIGIGQDLMGGFIQGIRERMGEMFQYAQDIRDELAEIFDMAGMFARIGRGAMSAFQRWTVDPLREELEQLEDQIAEIEAMERPISFPEAIEHLRLLDEQTAKRNELADAEERVLALREQQAQLGFLETQLKLLDLIESRGLDPAEVLGGAALGIAADPGAIMDAMTRAMTAVVERAQYELTIEAMGGRASAPALFQRPAMTMPVSTSSTVNVDMGGVNIYDQMSWAVFEANVRQIMARSV